MEKIKKIKFKRKRSGGKGQAYVLRNMILVLARELASSVATFEALGKVFEMDRKTAHDIYKRDRKQYLEIIFQSREFGKFLKKYEKSKIG